MPAAAAERDIPATEGLELSSAAWEPTSAKNLRKARSRSVTGGGVGARQVPAKPMTAMNPGGRPPVNPDALGRVYNWERPKW